MSIYDRMAATTKRLLRPASAGGFGQGVIQLVRYAEVVDAASNPWDAPEPPERDVTVLDAVSRGVSAGLVGSTVAPGVHVMTTDQEVLSAPWSGEYRPTDVLEIDGMPVTVLRVDNIPPVGTVCAIRFIVRG